MNATAARVVALSLLPLGFTVGDVAEWLRAHPRAVVALLA